MIDEVNRTGLADVLVLDTGEGPFSLRPEQPSDDGFLYDLFRSHTLSGLAHLAVEDATKEALLRMQFRSQTMSYRAQYAGSRFDILERDGIPFGRLIVHEDAGVATFVDFALLSHARGAGVGTAVIRRVLDWVAERCSIVRVSILSSNEASLRLTRRLGFVQTGETPPFVAMEWRRP